MKPVDVVIASFQTRDLLADCLASLEAANTRVIVVDNASTDGSGQMVRTRFPEVTLIELDRNIGFAAANNLGLRHTASDFVLLLNADTVVQSGAVEAMVDALDRWPEAGLCGARLVYPDGRDQDCAFDLPTLAMAFLDVFPLNHRLLGGRLNGRHRVAGRTEPFTIGHPLGACMLVRRAAFEAVGGLDEGYFFYAEEVDWCIRLRRAGWAVICAPSAVVTHHGGASASQFRERMLIELFRSRYRLFRLHFSPAYQRAARGIYWFGYLWATLGLWLASRRRQLSAEDRARLRAYRRIMALQ